MRRRDVALGLAGLASLSVLPMLPPRRAGCRADLPKGGDPRSKHSGLLGERLRTARSLYNVLRALAELGYVEGQNILFELRFANHALERLPALAAELVAKQPAMYSDTYYRAARGPPRAQAIRIPTVVAPVAEETMAALVPDFAQPPGNITGLTLTSREQREKCLQLFKEAVPGIRRVGVLFNPLNPAWRGYPEVMGDTAHALGIELVRVEAQASTMSMKHSRRRWLRALTRSYGLPESTLIGAEPTSQRIINLLASLPPAVCFRGGTTSRREGGLLSLGH